MSGKNSKSVGIWGLTSICVAFTITLNNFAVGAGVMVNMSFWRGIGAIALSWIALTLVWMFSGLIGASTGKNAASIFRYVFGRDGFRIPSVCMCLALTGFAIFDYWFVGQALLNMFPNTPVMFYVGIALIVTCAIIGTIKDISSLKWLTGLTIPVALVLFFIIMAVTINKVGFHTILSYQPPFEMPMVTAVNVLFSSFIAVTSGFSDITCHASKKAVFVAMPLCMLAIAFQFLVAQFGTYGMAIVDFTSLAVALGGAMFYLCNVFTLFAQANTVPSGTMIISTQINEDFRVPKKVMIVIQPCLSALGSILLFVGADISIITNFANILGCMFGPLLAIIFAEFYIVRGRQLPDDAVLPKFSKSGLICLGIGFALGVYLTYFATFATPVAILLFVICFILHTILRKVAHLN